MKGPIPVLENISHINMLPPPNLIDFFFTNLGSNLSPLHHLTYSGVRANQIKLTFPAEEHSCPVIIGSETMPV